MILSADNNGQEEHPSFKYPENTMTHLEFFKKFKRLNPVEPTLAIFGFFFVSVVVILCFIYLDPRTVVGGMSTRGTVWSGLHDFSSNGGNVRPGFLDENGDGCDVFDGNWVWDESYPLYQSQNCAFIDEGFRCIENGRPDTFYTKWRWQPKHCNLPRFDARKMLENLRNRRLAFVGDSIGRNQWESMLCILSSAVTNKSSIYEVNGSPITKHSGFFIFKFKDFNCTIEYYRSPFLVAQRHAKSGSPKEVKVTLRVDQIDWTSNQWRDADLLILNSGHWWSYEKTIREGSYFQEGKEIKMSMSVENAFRRSIQTVIDWVFKEVNTSKTYVLFRTFSPVHFRGGNWNTGGGCNLETLPDWGSSPAESYFKTVADVLSERSNKSDAKKLDLLNITTMTVQRKDGHSSIYYLNRESGPASLYRQDCSHWCLPGIPDSWNELVYALFMKHESLRSSCDR